VTSVADLLRDASIRLRASGVESARIDARLLLGEAMQREIWPHESGPVTPAQLACFEDLLARRLTREPVSRILGRRAFWTLDLIVGPDTLDPRPDTETLIEAAIAAFADREPPNRIIDLGTGTGCLLLAALSAFPAATGLGIDKSKGAVEIARTNAVRNELSARAEFQTIDWDELPQDRGDLILSNPPYIEEATLSALAPEVVQFDPRDALSGGADGLEAYDSLAGVLPRLMAPQGIAILELGAGQRSAVETLMIGVGFAVQEVRKDLGNIERALVLKWNDTGDGGLDLRHLCLE
jgi:release factor glutamine methyltransferase